MHEKYVERKIAKVLTAGGYADIHAKTMAAFIHECEEDAEEVSEEMSAGISQTKETGEDRPKVLKYKSVKFNPEAIDPLQISVWKGARHAMATKFGELLAKCGNWPKGKVNELSDVMTQNPKWRSAMLPVPTLASSYDLGAGFEFIPCPGSEPWLLAMRAGTLRASPAGLPLPGVGQFVYSEDCDWFLQILDVGAVLKQGIVIGEMMSFLETKLGQAELDPKTGSYALYHLTKGEFAYIPWGYFMVPLYMTRPGCDRECGYMWSMPVFSTEVARQVDKRVLQAVATFNIGQLEKETKPMWKRRREIFTMFCKDLDVSTTLVPEPAAIATSNN